MIKRLALKHMLVVNQWHGNNIVKLSNICQKIQWCDNTILFSDYDKKEVNCDALT